MSKERFCEFQGITEENFNEDFFKSVMELDYKDWRISYRKAEYIYENRINDKGKSYIEIAKEFIDESIQLLSINKDTELDSVIDNPFVLLGLKTGKENNVYQLAGQIYAQLAIKDNAYKDNALKYYQKYQVFQQKYEPHKFVDNLSEISVYSFRKYSVFTLEDLINETITVVRPSKMNDPFDSIADLWRKTECLKKITGGKGHEDLFNRSMNYFRIRSFQADRKSYSANNDILQSVKMWSHYADNHQGFCIKYRLKKKFFRDINEKDSIVLRIAPVEYEEQSVIDKSMKTLNAFDAYFVKNKEWEEECEVRLLSYNPHTEEDHYAVPMDDDAKIEEVIFGYLCTDDCKKTIYNLLSPKGVNFYLMKPNPEVDIYHLIKEKYRP